MTRDEFLENLEHVEEFGVYQTSLYSKLFSRIVKIWIYSEKDDKENDITELEVKRLNGFLKLDISIEEKIKTEIWDHFNVCVSNIDYGFVPQVLVDNYGGNTELANREYFQCLDSNDSFKKAELDYVFFSDVSNKEDIIFQLIFKVPWENEHGLTMTLINGRIEFID
ncbi:hypothetical protein GCM10027275_20670 [Rhabdobacter roseus]|uniref:DUF6985 domain-containing protein n=1 Tax=Rhabdobacter roseus TaxID=1655419 RepID=A0A840TV76_9BACT|nr:hypothetical protein [Rhabdobacter roseus]MBB5283998.1 hypothetical protein [Rhabdobacter roseus]